ncbi:MAG: PD-(D/E)XK nuclease family protein [Candidatus Porifericomitaceae bacterium WSBS_2022_MAG_OTU9]
MNLFEPEFVESSHTYFQPGSRKRLPSVTQVCEVAYKVRPSYPADAAKRGQQRHNEVAKAISAHMAGLMPLDSAPATGALRLLQDMGAQPLYVEQAMYSPSLSYAGRIDLIAKIDGELTIIDWKGGSHTQVYNLQVAGYALMASEILNQPVQHGLLVNWENKQKTWRLRPYPDNPKNLILQQNTDAFRACLTLWHWRQCNLKEY